MGLIKSIKEGKSLLERMDNVEKYHSQKFTEEKENNCLVSVYGRSYTNTAKKIPLNEISMNRLLGKHYNTGGFAIVSASRGDYTPQENDERTKEMYAMIIASEFRFIPAFGGFIETDEKTGEKRNNVEEKIAIILCYDKEGKEIPFQRLQDFAIRLGNKFEQESVLIKAPQENPKYIVTTAGKNQKVGDVDMEFTGEVRLNDLTQDYFTNMMSKRGNVGKNRFTFTEQYITPTFSTRNEGHIRHLKGEVFFTPNQAKSVLEEMENNKKQQPQVLKESSFNRIMQWIENYEIALITAFRGMKDNVLHPDKVKDDGKQEGERYTRAENRERNRELVAALLRLGYGVTKVQGVYIENYGTAKEQAPADEESILVVNKTEDPDFYRNIFRLSEYYNQDCFCYKAKGDDVAYNVGTNNADYPGYGNRMENGRLVKNVANEFMTRLGNRGFTFTDKEPSELGQFNTSHEQRKVERMAKRTNTALTEEFKWYRNESLGAKESIAYACKDVMKFLNENK